MRAGTKNANFSLRNKIEMKNKIKINRWYIRVLKWMKYTVIWTAKRNEKKNESRRRKKKKKKSEKNVFMIEVNSVCVPKDERKIYHALETLADFFCCSSSLELWRMSEYNAISISSNTHKNNSRKMSTEEAKTFQCFLEVVLLLLLFLRFLRKRFSTFG